MTDKAAEASPLELFLVSDGTGDTVRHAADAAATQFSPRFRVLSFGEVRREAQVRRIVEQAREARALIVFTLVNEHLAQMVRELASGAGVPAVDLLGPLISSMANHYGLVPQFRPGLLHSFGEDYFERVSAVEFAVHHDDGANLHTLHQADLVLAGVSRTSKTPISMYLAQRGYKAGNVPIVPDIEPPRELLEINPAKVFGLMTDPVQLLEIRRARLRQLGATKGMRYAELDEVRDELRRTRRLFRARGWKVVDITGKAVEENAARILEALQPGR